jgi:hypothetical protein
MELRPACAVVSYSEDREWMLFHARSDASLSMRDIALARNIAQRIFHFVFENALFAMFQIGRECLKMRRLNTNTQSCKLPKKYNRNGHMQPACHAF